MYPAQQPSGAPPGSTIPNGHPQTVHTAGFQKVPLQSQTPQSFDSQQQFQPSVQNVSNQFGNMNFRPGSAPQAAPNPVSQGSQFPPGLSSPSYPQFTPTVPKANHAPSHAPTFPNTANREPQFAPVQASGAMRPSSSLHAFSNPAAPVPNSAPNSTTAPGIMPGRFPQPPRFMNGPSNSPSAPQPQLAPAGVGSHQQYSQPQPDLTGQSWSQPVSGHPEQPMPAVSAPNSTPMAPISSPPYMAPASGTTFPAPVPAMAPMAPQPGMLRYPQGATAHNTAPQTFPSFAPPASNNQGMMQQQQQFGAFQQQNAGAYQQGYGNVADYQQNQYAGTPQFPPPQGGMFPPGQPPPGQYAPGQPPPGQFPGAFPGGAPPMMNPGSAPPMMNGQQYMGPGAPPMGAAPGYMGPGKKPGPAGGLTNEGLPSAIDVLERDMANNSSGWYESRLASVLPPLVTTKAKSRDMGNTVPELLRSSLYVAPATASLLKESGIPFVLHMQPMAELPADTPPIPVVYHGDQGPVRCNRCKAYMSPYMKFIDGGRKFQCPFCFVATECPEHYFQYLDSEGRRVDMMQRPELCLGSYEFLATKDYCKHEKLPEPPAFIFMIDVSYRAISSGFVTLICNMLRNELESLLPVDTSGQDSKLRVGFATFSDSVHFFNLKSNLTKPNMMTVNDFTDMFVPIVDGFLVRLEESGKMLDTLLEYIPQIFANSRETDTILYPVIQSGMRALEAAGCPGKLFVFNFSLPVFDAPGKLKNREDRALLGTDKEKTLLKPQIPDYTKLGEECVSVGCCVDLFLFPNQYVDVATLGEVSRITGGQIYKYNFFQPDKDGNRFLWDLRHDLKRNIAFDAVMRVRTNAGIRPTDYFGNMFMPNTTEVHLAALDSEKAILAEIKHDDKLEDKSIVHIQVALLYTSLSAQRRVRVMNLALNASTEFPEMYRCAEIDVIMNFMMKNSLKGLFEFSPSAIREGLAERTTRMLVSYRKHCSSQTPAGQLVLPESLKLLPIYANCLSRSDIVSGTGSDVGADDRSWLIAHANSLPVEHSTAFLYPRLYVLNELNTESPDYFRQIRCTAEKMQETGCYLLENSIGMFLWVGRNVDSQFLMDVFGVPTVAQMEVEKGGESALSMAKNSNADRIRRFIERTRASRPLYMRLTIVRQGDATQENWFRRFLVEDKGVNAVQQSYVDFIYYLYNQIRDELDK